MSDAGHLDLSRPRVIHVLGVGGSGMSGIATVLARMGHRVSGSDLRPSATLDRLRALGVEVSVGHASEHLPADADAVVASTAIPAHNPEVREAADRGVPVLRRAAALRALTATRRTVAVSGTHGKTTTSSMLAMVLRAAGWRPSFLVGGELNEVGGNAVYDEGEWLVVEADESDGTFLEVEAEAVTVTNVEPDHLDHWGDFRALRDAFERFLAAAAVSVVGADDPTAMELAPDHAVTFGFAEDARYRVSGYEPGATGSGFHLSGVGDVRLPVPGRHNVLNAAAALSTAVELGVPPDVAATSLGGFAGVSRRFEFRGVVDGVTVVDDYAHLPSEVRAVVGAAREGPWQRVVAVFQPHRFSRTEALWEDFGDAFDGADVVVLTDVYPAGEAPRPGVSGRLVLRSVLDSGSAGRVVYLPRRRDVERLLPSLSRHGDVVLTLGAGDVTSVADAWLESAGEGGR